MMAFMFVISKNNPSTLLNGRMMMMGTVGMMAGGGGRGNKKGEMNEDRKDYMRYLGQMRERARGSHERAARRTRVGAPGSAGAVVHRDQPPDVERRSADSDFMHLRVGRGSQRLDTRLVPPQTVRGRTGADRHARPPAVRPGDSIVPELPVSIALRSFAAVGLQGDKDQVRALARAMIGQMATFHTRTTC